MLDTAIGPKSDPAALDEIRAQLGRAPWTGTLYVGYPLVQTARGAVALDALLMCREHGVVIFDVLRGAARMDQAGLALRQAALRDALHTALARAGRVIVNGRLVADIRVLTVDPDVGTPSSGDVPGGAPLLGVRASNVPASAAVARTPSASRVDPRIRYGFAPGPAPSTPTPPTAAPGEGVPRPGGGRVGAARTERAGSAGSGGITGETPGAVTALAGVRAAVAQGAGIDGGSLRVLEQAVQRLGSVRPAAEAASVGALAGPRAGVLAAIDGQIATMDRWQKIAAIETPDGPQRIRGLAGSGKTIVLAHKAAFLHARKPAWHIALTFYARTLYEPLEALVRRSFLDLTGREPDWTHLHLQHAWGDPARPGICRDVARHVGLASTSGYAAERRYGRSGMFAGVCREVLAAMGPVDPEPLYDVVLIDEAQDLPPAFFEMVYRVTRPPKRVVWAYDELQNLSEYETASPAALFGTDASGRPRVPELPRVEGEAQQDIILPVCYRNTPWALTTAHALGLGVYRTLPPGSVGPGLVQFYDDPKLWDEIGYAVVEGALVPGTRVVLARARGSSPAYFVRLLTSDDAIRCEAFETAAEEADWVADEIARNLGDDGLAPQNVLVVSANPYFRADDALPFVQALQRRGVRAHVAGAPGRRDALFGTEPTVAVSLVNRAKGGEAPMVYVVQAEHGASEDSRVKRRNALFAAITRSRAWVRISGSGEGMRAIRDEVARVAASGYRLDVVVPTPAELARMRRLPRDMTRRQQRALVRAGRAGALALADLVRADPSLLGEAMRTLPPEDIAALRAALRALDGGA